jgi:hypothetical protein
MNTYQSNNISNANPHEIKRITVTLSMLDPNRLVAIHWNRNDNSLYGVLIVPSTVKDLYREGYAWYKSDTVANVLDSLNYQLA